MTNVERSDQNPPQRRRDFKAWSNRTPACPRLSAALPNEAVLDQGGDHPTPTPTLLGAMLTSRLNSRSGASRSGASIGLQPSPALCRARPRNDARSLTDGPHTRILVGRLWQDARRDVALARAAPPQMEQIHAPRAGVRLGVKSVGVRASGTRYPRRQEPTPTREPNPGHFSLPSNVVSGMRPLGK